MSENVIEMVGCGKVDRVVLDCDEVMNEDGVRGLTGRVDLSVRQVAMSQGCRLSFDGREGCVLLLHATGG